MASGRKSAVIRDFAHAPSKVSATIDAVKVQYPNRHLVACLELHTYSSLSKDFLPQYAHTLDAAETALIYLNPATWERKGLPPISKKEIQDAFQHNNLQVYFDVKDFKKQLFSMEWENKNLLAMSSAQFGGLNFEELINFATQTS
jgi:UDP-N-acetylmuramate: L-alanyl-gamma-D-glutamyl-meso-diaminopimelate ligase